MPPSSVTIQGSNTSVPNVYAEPSYEEIVGDVVGGKVLALPISFPILEPYKPTLFESAQDLLGLVPGDPNIRRIAKSIFEASGDDAVSAPSGAMLVNTANSSRATLVLEDADTVTALTLKSRLWGAIGNRIRVTLAITAGVGGAPDEWVWTITLDGVTETFSVFVERLFTAEYSAVGDDFTTMTLKVLGGGSIAMDAAQDVLLAAGAADITWSSGHTWAGKVTLDPDKVPGASNTFTATVTGLDMTGTAASEIITWEAAEDDARQTSADYSRIDSIVFAETGTPVSPEFAVTGRAFSVDLGTLSTAAQLITALQGQTSITVTNISPLSLGVLTTELDLMDEDIAAGPEDVFNALTLNGLELNKSAIIEVEVGSAEPIAAFAATPLTGGWNGDTESYDDALFSLELEDVHVLSTVSSDASIHAKLRAHCVKMAGVGANERCAWVGSGDMETYEQNRQRMLALGTRHVGLAFQSIQVDGPLGVREWLAPPWHALRVAAMQAGIGASQPLTKKRPNIYDFRQHATLEPIVHKEKILKAMLTAVWKKPGEGIHYIRPLTTHNTSSNVALTDPSANESVNTAIRACRTVLTQFIGRAGSNADGSLKSRLESLTRQTLQALFRAGVIFGFVGTSVEATALADTWTIRFAMTPTYPINFIILRPQIVSFEFTPTALAA